MKTCIKRVSIFLEINTDKIKESDIDKLILMGINWRPNKPLLTGYVSEDDVELLNGMPFVLKVSNTTTLKYPFNLV